MKTLLLALLAFALMLKVTPSVSFAPSILTITVRAEPRMESRSLLVQMDSGEFYRESSVPMDGMNAAATNRFTWRDVPAGEYEVSAYLLGTSDTILESGKSQVTVR